MPIHLVSNPLHLLGLGEGGHDSLVFDERPGHVFEERSPVLKAAAELSERHAVPHGGARN